uniref:SP-RING-type domain-containing protein n=1 Tax=Strongyloides papillosus TaxID=174720 RepID=A0A0N5B5K6_STREA
MVFAEIEKKDKNLIIFSDLEMFEGKEKTLRDFFTFSMFKDTTKATKNFEEKLDDVKKNVYSDLKIEQQYKNTFYEEYNLSIYLNVVIMFVKPFEIPTNILLPIVQSKKDESGYHQMVKKATFAARGKLENFLNFNINQLYKDLGNSKIENKMKLTRFLSPPYSKYDWDLNKEVTALIGEYIGIHAHNIILKMFINCYNCCNDFKVTIIGKHILQCSPMNIRCPIPGCTTVEFTHRKRFMEHFNRNHWKQVKDSESSCFYNNNRYVN